MPVTDRRREDLLRRVAQARARLESAAPYSPDWDAAMAELEELERLLGDADAGANANPVASDGAPVAA